MFRPPNASGFGHFYKPRRPVPQQEDSSTSNPTEQSKKQAPDDKPIQAPGPRFLLNPGEKRKRQTPNAKPTQVPNQLIPLKPKEKGKGKATENNPTKTSKQLAQPKAKPSSSTLPSSRTILTAMVTKLSTKPAYVPPPPPSYLPRSLIPKPDPNQKPAPSRAARKLLLALQAIFPFHLITALDLLERDLVYRVFIKPSPTPPPYAAPKPRRKKRLAYAGKYPELKVKLEKEPPPLHAAALPVYHLVRSGQEPKKSRRGRGGGGNDWRYGGAPKTPLPVYVVQTKAWSCTCPTFALAASPFMVMRGTRRQRGKKYEIKDMDGEKDVGPDAWPEERGKWEFGGLSRGGSGGIGHGKGKVKGRMPCCKHLLACVLAERWGTVVGAYMQDMWMTREEVGGVFGLI